MTAQINPGDGDRRSGRRRSEDRSGPSQIQTVAATLIAVCGGLVVIYAFFAIFGAIDPLDAAVPTIAAVVLALVWFGAFVFRQRTAKDDPSQRINRERRGF